MMNVSQKVLCVDDQQEILDLLTKQLDADFDCVFVSHAGEALAVFDDEGPFAVVVADYEMPEIDGVEFLREINLRSPDTVPMMLTSHNELDVAIAALHEGNIFRFMRKPWDVKHLRSYIEDALEQYRLVVTERQLAVELASSNANLAKKVAQLNELNHLLEYWVEFSPAVIYSAAVEKDGLRPTYVSKNFSRLSGYERTEMVVDPGFWLQNVHPEDAAASQDALSQGIADGSEEVVREYRFRHRDGEYRWIYDSFRIIRDPGGEPLEIVGAWVDISDRKVAA